MNDTELRRRFLAALIIIGTTLLGTLAGVVTGLIVGAIPGVMALFEANSGGWNGIARAVVFLFLAGGFGLVGMLTGIWLGFRKACSKPS